MPLQFHHFIAFSEIIFFFKPAVQEKEGMEPLDTLFVQNSVKFKSIKVHQHFVEKARKKSFTKLDPKNYTLAQYDQKDFWGPIGFSQLF